MRFMPSIIAVAIAFSAVSAHALKIKLGQRFRIVDAQKFGAPFQINDVVELVTARLLDSEDGAPKAELGFRLYLEKREISKLTDPDHSAAGIYRIVIDNSLAASQIPGLGAP